MIKGRTRLGLLALLATSLGCGFIDPSAHATGLGGRERGPHLDDDIPRVVGTTGGGSVTIGTANGLSLAGTVLSLRAADSTHAGALSFADWVTFNGKQASGNYITSLTGGVTASGPGAAAATVVSVPASALPNPSSSTLGGTRSIAAVSHNFLTSISTSGVPAQAQPAFTDISGSLAAAQLPNPSAATLGGVESYAAVSNQWINTISTSGVPSSTQPAFSDISGSVSASQLPNPGASTLGGVKSLAAVSHNFLTSISTLGAPTQAQPAFTDISGSVAATQLPNPSATTLGGVESIAAVSHNFLTSISTSGVPAQAQPAFSDVSGSVAAGQLPAFSGDVTTSAGSTVTSIASSAVTNSQLAKMAANSIKGNNTGSAATAADLTVAQVNTLTGNSGDVTIASFGSAPTANALSISGQAITAQPADVSHPGMIKADNTLQQVGVAIEANQFVPLPVTLTWGTSVSVDMSTGGYFRLTASDTTTVPNFKAPTNPYGGDTLLLRVNNSSGGVMQTPTWDAAYHFISSTPPTKPGNGQSYWIQFKYNGSGTWHQMMPAAGPVPN